MDTDNFNQQSMLTAFRSESGPSKAQRDRLRQRLAASVALLPAAAASDVLAATGTAGGTGGGIGGLWAKLNIGAALSGKLAVGGGVSAALVASAVAWSVRDTPPTTAGQDGAAVEFHESAPASSQTPVQPEFVELNLDQLRAETELLEQARRALEAGHIDIADTALKAHAQRFASGALRPERRALQRAWACLAGQHGAKAEARAFLEAHPRDKYRASLRRACGLGPKVEL